MPRSFALKHGDKIAIVCTARWIEKDEVVYADEVFNSWGLMPVYGNSVTAKFNQYAGDDNLRAADLQTFLDDKDIKAIICARGGYGTIRIMDKLDFTALKKHPKWICGYSDVTVLHNYINNELKLPSLHSTMPVNFSTNSVETLTTLKAALFGENFSIETGNHRLNRQGIAKGEIIGGNLSLLYSLAAAKQIFSTDGKILFIEDVEEYLYHIDRMMISLKLAGMFTKLKGLIVGKLENMKDKIVAYGKSAEEIIIEHIPANIPVCFDFPAGHTADNRTLILGSRTRLEVDEKTATLTFSNAN
jgi:muramoyltetrapeptide carboxypeptidase